MRLPQVVVESERVRYSSKYIEAEYKYETSAVKKEGNTYKVQPIAVDCQFRTERTVPKLGVMLVGWGGNNGTTVTAAVLANKKNLTWKTRSGVQSANYYGSLTQASTADLGGGCHVPFCSLLPMVDPNNIVFGGWDISSLPLSDAMARAKVLDVGLQHQLWDEMAALKPKPGVYDPDFIAANQAERGDHVIGGTKREQLARLRADIRQFRRASSADTVIVLWTANTERFASVEEGVNTTEEELMQSVAAGHSEVSPSTLYAMAAILEGCAFINGSPQNTLVPGAVEMAENRGVFVGGDDFKSGQTKVKSVLVDFLVSAGIKPVSIVSYNHLGNNDGRNLSGPQQFRSKEISKSNVVDDMVASNSILYRPGERPDHTVVIKYVPYVGDSKRALDEYTSEIMCGGHNTLVLHNTCEDSLLAAPLILDLVILTELFQRISFRTAGETDFHRFHPVLSLLSYLCKAPLVPSGAPVVNALSKQRSALENVLRACIGLAPVSNMDIENRLPAKNRDAWTVFWQSGKQVGVGSTAGEGDEDFRAGGEQMNEVVKESDGKMKWNVGTAKGNDEQVKKNGGCVEENGKIVKQNGKAVQENGYQAKETYGALTEHTTKLKENGHVLDENIQLLIANGGAPSNCAEDASATGGSVFIDEQRDDCVKQPMGEVGYIKGTGNANGLNGRGE